MLVLQTSPTMASILRLPPSVVCGRIQGNSFASLCLGRRSCQTSDRDQYTQLLLLTVDTYKRTVCAGGLCLDVGDFCHQVRQSAVWKLVFEWLGATGTTGVYRKRQVVSGCPFNVVFQSQIGGADNGPAQSSVQEEVERGYQKEGYK